MGVTIAFNMYYVRNNMYYGQGARGKDALVWSCDEEGGWLLH